MGGKLAYFVLWWREKVARKAKESLKWQKGSGASATKP